MCASTTSLALTRRCRIATASAEADMSVKANGLTRPPAVFEYADQQGTDE
jgi:hypothetical protein